MRRGSSGNMQGRRTTLVEWWARWQGGRQVSLLGARREQSAWECWISPHLGNVKLAELRRSAVQAWVAGQVRGDLAPTTIAGGSGACAEATFEASGPGGLRYCDR
jgi:hypothetical protein